MKEIKEYLLTEKKTTGAGSVEMIQTIMRELHNCNNNKEVWKSLEQFLNDYLDELSDDNLQEIIDTLGFSQFTFNSKKQDIANGIIQYYKDEKYK